MGLSVDGLSAEDVVRQLKLSPHPEGGFYRETFRDAGAKVGGNAGEGLGRAASTAIYYLLRDGEVSHWHRVDSAEIWHWYGGGRIELSIAHNDFDQPQCYKLGPDFLVGEAPQIVVPPNAWQSAKGAGDWCLVGCTVAPGFEFEAFEMAPAGWQPGGA